MYKITVPCFLIVNIGDSADLQHLSQFGFDSATGVFDVRVSMQ